jgi:SAM-dependent methyltransferase
MRTHPLTDSNFIYRRPDLAEILCLPTADAHAQRWRDLISHQHPGARSLLDLGCWIGMDAERLSRRYAVVGVDIQPSLIDYARQHRSGVDFRVGDITSIRLGHKTDVILCVGNSLSYIHSPLELDAAFATFAAHARHGTLLILNTLLAPVVDTGPSAPYWLEVGEWRGAYTDRNEWCPLTQLLTTRRTWQYHDGTTEVDTLHRRVLPATELELRARLSGWDVLDVQFDPPDVAGSALGAAGCLVARFRAPETEARRQGRQHIRPTRFRSPTGASAARPWCASVTSTIGQSSDSHTRQP